MSSTNKTTNYELSQFVGSDKPAWLTDYNQDMAKIDAGIDAAQDTATGADGKANANTTNIGDLTYLSTTAKNNIVAAVNEINNTAQTAQNTANSANSTATTANTTANSLVSQFNLSVLKQPADLTVTTSVGSIQYNNITIISNTDQSLAKIYGEIRVTNTAGTGNCTITISNTGLTPDEDITIAGGGLRSPAMNEGVNAGGYPTYPLSFTIKSNGTITIEFTRNAIMNTFRILMFNSLLFLKDFGDIVTPE